MPTELEQRLRAERPRNPEFSDEARERARLTVLAARSRPARLAGARLRRLARPARIAFGGLGFAALAAFVALLVVAGPHKDEGSAGLRFADRSEGGVALHLKATPLKGSGLSASEAASQTAKVLLARAEVQGIAHVLAVPNKDGTVDAWVPVARSAEEVHALLVPTELQIYSLDRDLISRAPSAKAALQNAAGSPSSGAGRWYFLISGGGSGSSGGSGQGLLTAGPQPSIQALRRKVGGSLPRNSVVLSIPSDLALLRDAASREWVVVRNRPVVAGREIAQIERTTGGLSVQVTATAARRLGISQTGGRAGVPGSLVLAYGASDSALIAEPLTAPASGRADTLDLRAPALGARELLAQDAPLGPLAVDVSALAESPTGPVRRRAGTAISDARLLAGIAAAINVPSASRANDPVIRSLLVEVEQATPGLGDSLVVTGVNRQGRTFDLLADSRGRVAFIVGGGSSCQLTPWQPVMSLCQSTHVGGNGKSSAYGRVDQSVTSVVVQMAGGRRAQASLENGWWLAVTPSLAKRVLAYDDSGMLVANEAARSR